MQHKQHKTHVFVCFFSQGEGNVNIKLTKKHKHTNTSKHKHTHVANALNKKSTQNNTCVFFLRVKVTLTLCKQIKKHKTRKTQIINKTTQTNTHNKQKNTNKHTQINKQNPPPQQQKTQ